MCEKCTELDFKIAKFRRLADRINDQPAIDGIAGLIKEMIGAKAALHPALHQGANYAH
jgi:hypothetical protein